MNRIIPINNLKEYKLSKGHLATQDESTYPDWKMRLSRAQKESGKGIQIESYLKKRRKGHYLI